jgi:hypothetical protein
LFCMEIMDKGSGSQGWLWCFFWWFIGYGNYSGGRWIRDSFLEAEHSYTNWVQRGVKRLYTIWYFDRSACRILESLIAEGCGLSFFRLHSRQLSRSKAHRIPWSKQQQYQR